jgi:adenylate cyclase
LLNGPGSPEINTNARRLYEQAVELDPKNAVAFRGLAWTYIHDVQENWVVSEIGMREAIERADDAVKQALSINPRSASAFAAKSNLLAYSMKDDYRGEIAQAIEAAETALALDPNQPKIFGWLGRLYAKAGHPERTRDFVEQAIRLNPKSDPASLLYTLGMSQLQMGHNDEAIDSFQRSLLQHPRKLISWGGLTGALLAAGREVEAKNALVKWREIAVTDEGYKPSGDSTDREILIIRMQLALLRLGRWTYALDFVPDGPGPPRALSKFQVDENLPQTGQLDEATLARLGIASQSSAIPSK